MTLFILYSLFLFFPSPAFATNTGQFTAEVWVKPATSVASKAILGKSEEMRIFTDASGYVGCQIKATTWQTAATATTNALTLNSWTHVACTYDKSNIKVYVNGVQVATQAETDAPDDTAAAFEIGEDDSASTTYTNLTGTVDNFQFYNYARTAKQVVQDMTGTGSVILSDSEGSPANAGRPAAAVGYWKFDEGYLTTANNSGNGGSALNGTLTGMSSPATSTSGWTPSGKFGKGLVFDGSNDYVAVSDNNALDVTSDLTISAWVNTNSIAGTDQYILNKDDVTVNRSYTLYLKNGKLQSFIFKSDSTYVQAASTNAVVTTGSWYHVLMIYNNTTNSVAMYVNGKSVAVTISNTATGSIQSTSADLWIGRRNYGSSPGNFNGSIDEVKIYNYALTADEVKAEFNRGQSLQLGALGNNTSYTPQATNQIYCVPGDTTSCTAPVAEWNFEEGSGTSVKDTSGNNNTGTWAGTGTKHWDVGKVGSGGKFNGTDDYVSAGTGLNLTSPFTLSAWVNPSSLPSSGNQINIINKYQNGAAGNTLRSYWLALKNNSGTIQVRAGVMDGSGNYTIYLGGNISTGSWQYISTTYDKSLGNNNRWKIYVNGVQQTTSVESTNDNNVDPQNTAETVFIGATDSTTGALNFFPGKIDQVRVFNYARTPAQIAWDYNKGAPVGHWRMDECQGVSINDSSGNGNTGTLTIGASGTQTTGGTCTAPTDGTGAWYNGRNGKRNYSLNFDGTDDYVDIGDPSNGSLEINSGLITVSAWIYPTADGDRPILSKDDYNGVRGYYFRLRTGGTIHFYANDGAAKNYETGALINQNEWSHVVAVSDGTKYIIYKNGKEVGRSTQSLGTVSTALSLTIGKQIAATTQYFPGQIDDVKIFNYALTASQVKTLYNNGAIFYGPVTGAP